LLGLKHWASHFSSCRREFIPSDSTWSPAPTLEATEFEGTWVSPGCFGRPSLSLGIARVRRVPASGSAWYGVKRRVRCLLTKLRPTSCWVPPDVEHTFGLAEARAPNAAA